MQQCAASVASTARSCTALANHAYNNKKQVGCDAATRNLEASPKVELLLAVITEQDSSSSSYRGSIGASMAH